MRYCCTTGRFIIAAMTGSGLSARHGPQPVRLSRGSIPRSVSVPIAAPVPILGMGGDIKNSFCLLANSNALMSQYIGTLESVATQDHFRDSLEKWIAFERYYAECRRSRSASADRLRAKWPSDLVCQPWVCSIIMRTSPRAWLKTDIRVP